MLTVRRAPNNFNKKTSCYWQSSFAFKRWLQISIIHQNQGTSIWEGNTVAVEVRARRGYPKMITMFGKTIYCFGSELKTRTLRNILNHVHMIAWPILNQSLVSSHFRYSFAESGWNSQVPGLMTWRMGHCIQSWTRSQDVLLCQNHWPWLSPHEHVTYVNKCTQNQQTE